MAYRTELDSDGFHLINTETGQRTTYTSRDALMYAAATVATRSWDRVLDGITRLLESYERPSTPQATEEPATP